MKDTYNEVITPPQTKTTPAIKQPGLNPVERDRLRQSQQGYGAMTVAMSMAGGAREGGKEPRIVTYARMFLILFAMLLPSLLLIRVVL